MAKFFRNAIFAVIFITGLKMTSNQNLAANSEAQYLENQGPIKKLSVPTSWSVQKRVESAGVFRFTFTDMTPEDKKVTIAVLHRGQLLSDNSVKNFRTFLEAHAELQAEEKLSGEEIKKLYQVLGPYGSNQFTLDPDPDGRMAPFQVKFARLHRINGKVLLEMQGNFVNSENAATGFYRTLFIPADKTCHEFYELYLTAKTEAQFNAHQNQFESVLKSIVWN